MSCNQHVDVVAIVWDTLGSELFRVAGSPVGFGVGKQHLHRYLSEFEYRFNRRYDDDVFIQTVRRLCGVKPLRFADLVADEEPF